jgi:hypothetical protein
MRVESRLQTEGDYSVTEAQLREQALRSAAHLVAAMADRRFGAARLSDELKDCLGILRSELDELGMLAEYKQKDGSLVAWRPEDDGNIREVLRRASFVDDKPSRSPYTNEAWL